MDAQLKLARGDANFSSSENSFSGFCLLQAFFASHVTFEEYLSPHPQLSWHFLKVYALVLILQASQLKLDSKNVIMDTPLLVCLLPAAMLNVTRIILGMGP